MAPNQPKTFYIFHGNDEFNLAAQIAAMRAQMDDDLNTATFDGTKTTPGEVVAAVQVVPFLGDKRLVIVRGMLTHLNRRGGGQAAQDDLQYLTETLPTLPHSARLVFWEDKALPEKHPVLRLALQSPTGYVKLMSAPKNSNRWIQTQAQQYDVTIEPAAAAALANVTGNDLRVADGELLKLAAYVGSGNTIKPKDVALLTAYVADADIFSMVDAIGQRNGKQALVYLDRLLTDSHPLQLFSMIVRQFRLILLAREWLDSGGSASELPKAIGVHPFVAKKISEQARGYNGIVELEHIYRNLADVDYAIKTGKVGDRLALELFVAGLTKED